MTQQNGHGASLRGVAAAVLVASGLGGAVAPAQAQSGAMIEEIVVTGSRIPRAGFDTMQPATVLDSEFLESRAFTNVADALNEIPAFGLPGSSTQGTQASFSVGQSFVNFFGLGSQRTLTLVNGRRFVSSNAPTIFSDGAPGLQVDMNVLPSAMIERVETIAVGGAPIYGADAIAGTVNVIMKSDFEGFEIGGSWADHPGKGDFEERQLDLLWGANYADGRGNVVIAFQYNERDGLIANQRSHLARGWQFREPAGESEFTRILVPRGTANIVSRGGVVTPDPLLVPNVGLGAVDVDADGNPVFRQFGPDGSLIPYNVGEPTGSSIWSIGGEGLFLPDLENLFTPVERRIVNGFTSYELAPNVELFGEFLYANTNSTELINQPAYQSGVFGQESFALNFQADHPLLTPTAQQQLAELGLDNFWLQRASVDIGDRRNEQELHLYRFVGGLRGDFQIGDRNVGWEAYYSRGESDSDTRQVELISDRFFYALDVVDTPDGPACRVTADPASRPTDPSSEFGTSLPLNIFEDCVPLDLFGEGRPSQAAIDYVSANATSKTQITQEVWALNANMDLFTLPAGEFAIAAGYERRKEGARFDTDGILSGGLGRSVAIGSTAGSYKTDEFYAEFYAPVVSANMDIPFVENLSIEGAFRTVKNSLAGRDETWTIGGRLAPVDDIEFRGNVTRSVRAPAITELFLPLSGQFTFANDPCDQRFVDEGPNPDARRANCIADGIANPDDFTSNVVNASVQGVTGGNVDLDNEKADAWTVGVVLRPRWIDGLTMSVDYVDIDLEDAIEDFTLTQIMESCYDQDNFPNEFCGQFVRTPTGQLPAVDAFQSGFVNAGSRRFKAWMADIDYGLELSEVGLFSGFTNPGSLSARMSLYFPQKDITLIQEAEDDRHGQPDQNKRQGQLNLRWYRDAWSVLWQTRYLGKAVIDTNDTPTSRDIRKIDAAWYFNAGVSYDFNENVRLQLNIDNVFDKTPQPAAIAGGWSNAYGNLGRYVRGSVRIRL